MGVLLDAAITAARSRLIATDPVSEIAFETVAGSPVGCIVTSGTGRHRPARLPRARRSDVRAVLCLRREAVARYREKWVRGMTERRRLCRRCYGMAVRRAQAAVEPLPRTIAPGAR